MKVVFNEAFYPCYTDDPAAAAGRMDAIVSVIQDKVIFADAEPATEEDILAVHTHEIFKRAKRKNVLEYALLAAGGAMQTARIGLTEPAFGLIRPPGHHASADMAFGFCYFNNMAVALTAIKRQGAVRSAMILDIDFHYGDGTVNILGSEDWVTIYNPCSRDREEYLTEVKEALENMHADIIGVSAGFDAHQTDWGGVLATEDYETIGTMVRDAARRSDAGRFALLEGGYNHKVLGYSVSAFLDGFSGKF